MSQGLPWGDSPVDLASEEPQDIIFADTEIADVFNPQERTAAWQLSGLTSGIGWATGAIATSSLALVLLNTHALSNWADQQPVNAVTASVVAIVNSWHETAGKWHLNTVVNEVEKAANAMRKAPWPHLSYTSTRLAIYAVNPDLV